MSALRGEPGTTQSAGGGAPGAFSLPLRGTGLPTQRLWHGASDAGVHKLAMLERVIMPPP